MTRKWIETIGGYIIVALLGVMVILVATAYLRASTVQREIEAAERRCVQGKPGAALGHLDRIRGWAGLYPVLEKQRLLAAIRCHVQRMDIPRATEHAEAVLAVSKYHMGSQSIISLFERMPAELINTTILRNTGNDPLAAWDGYVTMMHELRRFGRAELLPSVAESIASRFPGGLLPPPIRAALRDPSSRGAQPVRRGPASAPVAPTVTDVTPPATSAPAITKSTPAPHPELQQLEDELARVEEALEERR